ncbi:STAS domain-containing protein [Fulvimarina sp. MAC3]|uniref:STAS domain-containing protein n=1 Tax=Fulvimarina sp. MAC3 TaxID=3148887 RepID=UPI0031FD8ACB
MSYGYGATGSQGDPSVVVALPEDCTIRGVHAMTSCLTQNIHGPSPMFDSRAVKTFDVVGLQMLLSAQKTAQGSGTAIQIIADDECALRVAAERAGLMAEFEKLFIPSPPT